MSIRHGLPDTTIHYDLCVVGAGPVGLAVAMEAAGLGQEVLLLESGTDTWLGSSSVAPYGRVVDEARHAPMNVAVCRALGGTSWWWGGRCLPMDPVDYMPRPFVPGSGWPIAPADLEPFYSRAAAFLDCGVPEFFSASDRWKGIGGGVRVGALERWAKTREMARLHGQAVQDHLGITVCLGVTVDRLETTSGHVVGLGLSSAEDRGQVAANQVVLACGGLGTAKLLLAHRRSDPASFGGESGALGHFYMGHTHGKIADIVLADPDLADSMDFFLDESGTWVRRRIDIDAPTQIANGLLNTAFWVDNAAFYDWRHRSGILSAVYLALCIPPVGRLLVAEGIRRMHIGKGGDYGRHLANVLLHPFATVASAWQILRQRYLEKPRRPGFLIRNPSGRYALTYHGEQLPVRESQATLDADGQLVVDLRFAEADAVSVVRAHELVDRALRASGLGHLDYHMPASERVAAVLAQAADGYHQEGLLRMGTDPRTSVVDADCRVHGFDNLFVASTGVLPTSGQANPTFTACALGIRLADHLATKGGIRAAA